MKFIAIIVAVGLLAVDLANAADIRLSRRNRDRRRAARNAVLKQRTSAEMKTAARVKHTTARNYKKPRVESDDGGPSLIVGGANAAVGEFPYYVDLDGCGGSLIAPGVVLSAAHCQPSDFNYVGERAIVGGFDRQQVTNGAQEATIERVDLHPQYDPSQEYMDIMVMKLDRAVTVSGVTLSVNTAPGTPVGGQLLTVIGTGNTQEGGTQSNVLKHVEVPTVNTNTCNGSYQGSVVDEVMFCAGGKSGEDSCQGDSGGPIVIRNGNQHTQVGVVSWGEGCARENFPGVYARTSAAMNWIAFIVCECYGVNDPGICSSYNHDDNNFSCDGTGNTGEPGGTGGTASTCTDSGFLDIDDFSCDDYEENDECHLAEEFANAAGDNANKCCDFCKSSSTGGSTGGTTSTCTDSGFLDIDDFSCDDYEEFDECHLAEEYANAAGDNANKCCDFCKSGSTGGSTGGTTFTCTDSGFLDIDDFSCEDYEVFEFGCDDAQDYASAAGYHAGVCCDYCM